MLEHEIMERSHNINFKFNKIFSGPLFIIAWLMTVILLFSPYWLRTAIAFLVNFFFNRPVVYHFYFFEKIGKKMNLIVITAFYFFIFGLYAILYKIRGNKPNAGWLSSASELDAESHRFQS